MLEILRRITMGCICEKESLLIDNRKFYFRSKLAQGGFSRVELIEDKNTKELFAIKKIDCHNGTDKKLAEDEIKITSRLHHRNIIELICSEIIPVEDRVGPNVPDFEALLVMPYYRRGTLFDYISRIRSRNEFLSENNILEMFEQICQAVSYMHTMNPSYSHRDLKPHNVLLDDELQPILMDFGSATISRPTIDTSQQAAVFQDFVNERCSMPYRPPELFNVQVGNSVSEKADIWSLGCTLFAICWGESPFDQVYCRGDSIALAVLANRIKFPESWPFSENLKQLINEMITISIDERPDIHLVLLKVSSMLRTEQNRV